jgi:ferredoxin
LKKNPLKTNLGVKTMSVKTVRTIVKIDEKKCNGCGACTSKCTEGALQLIDGKARLISENYCDGLGACLGECPVGAIIIEERTADNFDEAAVKHHLREAKHQPQVPISGCPGSRMIQITSEAVAGTQRKTEAQPSTLCHWPVQLTLVPTRAPFLQGSDVLLTAHCVPFAYADFHQDFLKDHALLIACPKLDDAEAHFEKLTAVLKDSDVKSLTVLRMEVPCCGGLVYMAQKAITASGKNIPFKEVKIGVKGDVKN